MKNDFKPAVGHRFTLRTHPWPNWNGVIDCQVLAVEPNKTLSYTWGALGPESAVTLSSTPTAPAPYLRMEQSGFRPDQPPTTRAPSRLAAVLRPGAGFGAR